MNNNRAKEVGQLYAMIDSNTLRGRTKVLEIKGTEMEHKDVLGR